MTFEPLGRKSVKHQLVLASIDYVQLFGTYRGTMQIADRSHEIADARGVYESMTARL